MIRPIDANALEKEGWSLHRTVNVDSHTMEHQVKQIAEVPTIEPERTGKWIRHPEQRNIYGGKTIECSECQTKYVVQYIEDEKYCRNCGARMES